MARWTELTAQAFPRFRSRITCFGYDWLGRHFALDSGRIEGGQPLVLSLEPEIGQAFEIPATFADFHDVELADHPDEAIASEVYAEWRAAAGPIPLPPDKCVGLKVPLFLGGTASVDNMEITDMEVYWSLCGQLLTGSGPLPPGTPIDSVSISDEQQ